MIEKTVAELSAALQAGAISSVELTKAYLDRIARFNGELNAFITVCEESALVQAAAADQARAGGDERPLLGIPLAHKDIFCTEGVKTTCGSHMLHNFISPYNATVVEKFIDAGTVMLGKTNMDEFAMGSSNETSYFGPVRNPWDPPQPWPPICAPWQPGPILAALFASQPLSAALPDSSPATAGFRAGA
jgi:aspartyl-tRNA(Asn)/glutamyl-tRNA(Gln) amidotransferase subunit A